VPAVPTRDQSPAATFICPRRGPWLQLLAPHGIEFNRLELPIESLPAAQVGLRILHLSDCHFRKQWYSAYDRILERISADPPDLICFTGDLVDARWDPSAALPTARRFLQGLRSRLGTFGIIGNHDGDLLAPHVRDWGMRLLHPGIARVRIGDTELEILGLPCVSRGDAPPRLLRRFPPRQANVPRIVLSHYPDHFPRLNVLAADIVLCGHTHGGQVCLPGGRPIITHDTLERRYSHGAHRFDDTWLVISRGFGFATYCIRVFAPAEVVEVVLRRCAVEGCANDAANVDDARAGSRRATGRRDDLALPAEK